MKRDMDLAREILAQVEASTETGGWVELNLPNREEPEVWNHVHLLAEAGLIEAVDLRAHDGLRWEPKRLTWSGHDFIEASRDPSRWEKAKSIVRDRGGAMVLEALKDVLITLARQAVAGG